MTKKRKKKKSRSASNKFLCPVADLIGFTISGSGRGKAVGKMTARKEHGNPVGRMHGGILCDFADATMGYAFLSQLPAGRKGVAANFQISFLNAVHIGDRLQAKAHTVSHGRSLYFMECEVRTRSGKVIAKASSTCKILPRGRK